MSAETEKAPPDILKSKSNVGTEDSVVILIFIYYKCYITLFNKVLSIHLWCCF